MSRAINAGTGSFTAMGALPELRFLGYAVREIGGAAATVIIRHGPVGPILATINLAAKQAANDWPEAGGTPTPNGIYVERIGVADVQVFMRS